MPKGLKQLTVFPLLFWPKVEWAHPPNSHWWTSLPESCRTNCCDSAGLATVITSASVTLYLSATPWTRSFVANNSFHCQQLRQPTGGGEVRSPNKCCASARDVMKLCVAWSGRRDPVSSLQTSRWQILRLPLECYFWNCATFSSQVESLEVSFPLSVLLTNAWNENNVSCLWIRSRCLWWRVVCSLWGVDGWMWPPFPAGCFLMHKSAWKAENASVH